jgi:hypothetical protein
MKQSLLGDHNNVRFTVIRISATDKRAAVICIAFLKPKSTISNNALAPPYPQSPARRIQEISRAHADLGNRASVRFFPD